MSDLNFNNWYHQSGSGGVHQTGIGSVGIGSQQPTATLDVNGSINFSGGFDLEILQGDSSVTNGTKITELNFNGDGVNVALNGTIANVTPPAGGSVSFASSIATTTGASTSFVFTGTKPTIIEFGFDNIVLSTAVSMYIRLGITTGTLISSGYDCIVSDNGTDSTASTIGFPLQNNTAVTAPHLGIMRFVNAWGTTWIGTGFIAGSNNQVYSASGSIDIGGEIAEIGVELASSSFSSGAINIAYY